MIGDKLGMTDITERTHKLLILVGEEGPSLESRDFKKLVDVIVNDYIATNKPSFEQVPHSLYLVFPGTIPNGHPQSATKATHLRRPDRLNPQSESTPFLSNIQTSYQQLGERFK